MASPFSATEHHVAVTIATYMSPNGDSCFPSIPRLAAGSGRSASTIRDALNKIVAYGFLARTRRRGRGHTNEYAARIPDYFDWYASSEENRRSAEVFATGHEQLEFGPAVEPVPDATSATSRKTTGERRFYGSGGEEENLRSASLKPPVSGEKTTGVRCRSNQGPSQGPPQQQTSSLETPSQHSQSAAAEELRPVSIEQAIGSLAKLAGWDTGSLQVVLPLIQGLPAELFEQTLEKTLARAADNPPGLLVYLLRVAIGDWRQAQNDARLATWDAFFGEAGIERVKAEDPDRYVLAWATPALDAARPLPPVLVVGHVLEYVYAHTADPADRKRLLDVFLAAADRIPSVRAAHEWVLTAIDRHRRPLDEVLAFIADFMAGSPQDDVDELVAFAREVAANVEASDASRKVA